MGLIGFVSYVVCVMDILMECVWFVNYEDFVL